MLLLTGITGKSGRVFWDTITSHPKEFETLFPDGVRLAIRSESGNKFENRSVIKPQILYGDLHDENFLDKITESIDTVLHIAGIHWSLPLVKASLNHGVHRLILVHTTGVYSKYKSASEEYKKIDAEIEKLAAEHQVDLTILRPTMIYGNVYDKNMIIFIKMIDHLKFMPVVDYAQYALQPVHYEDLGKAYYQVLINPEKTKNKNYNLSGENPILLSEIFQKIAEDLGVQRRFISVPQKPAYIAALLLYLLTMHKFDFREKVQRLCESRVFDHNAATQDFGYNPMEFSKGIHQEIQEYMKARE
jgi:nucleoside-diphosphate-sugar epimerase